MNVQRIVVTLVAAAVFFFSFSAVPINAEEEGETLIREVSSALTTIARDIRGAHYRIEVQNDNDTVILVLHQFLVDEPSGIPKVGRKGYPKEGLPVKYVFSRENKILYREHLEGNQPLCEHFINIDFVAPSPDHYVLAIALELMLDVTAEESAYFANVEIRRALRDRTSALRFITKSSSKMTAMVRSDKRACGKEIAQKAASTPKALIWQGIAPLRTGTTKKAKAFGKPIPFILDEDGNAVSL